MGRRKDRKHSAKIVRQEAAVPAIPPIVGVIAAACVLIGATFFAYANSLDGAFVFDDQHHIEHNTTIQNFFPLAEHLRERRPLVSLSLAVNYAIGGLKPYGYHVVNLLVHMLAALTLFGVVRRTLLTPRVAAVFRGSATLYALAITALWALHPLTTQSVTYVIQRAESMMGLFYLLTLYCAIRSAESKRGGWWIGASIAACLCGMAAKAVMVTAPLVVLLYDRVFLSERFSEALRRRWPLYVGLCASWLVIAATGVLGGVFTTASENATVGFGYKDVTPLQYLSSQPGVILHYLSLSLWPADLCIDYAWPVAHGVAGIVLPAAAISVLLGLAVWMLWKRPAIGFVCVWFFLILLPTSSIIPIRDLAFEHRMYLPLVAIACLFVFGLRALIGAMLQRRAGDAAVVTVMVIVIAACAVALAMRTRDRNADYRSEFAIWSDTAAVRPSNARAFRGIGDAYFEASRFQDAIKQYEAALQLNEGESGRFVYERLGTACQFLGQLERAEHYFKLMLEIDPNSPTANYNLGNFHSQRGRPAEALAYYRRAVESDPDNAEAFINMGLAIAATADGDSSKGDEALDAYRRALDAAKRQGKRSVLAKAHYNSGLVLIWQGKVEAAISAFEQALEADPANREARQKLEKARGRLQAESGDASD